jgi:hypothetical protein
MQQNLRRIAKAIRLGECPDNSSKFLRKNYEKFDDFLKKITYGAFTFGKNRYFNRFSAHSETV